MSVPSMLEEKLGRPRELCDSPNTTRDKHAMSDMEIEQENDGVSGAPGCMVPRMHGPQDAQSPGCMIPGIQLPAAYLFPSRAVVLNDFFDPEPP